MPIENTIVSEAKGLLAQFKNAMDREEQVRIFRCLTPLLVFAHDSGSPLLEKEKAELIRIENEAVF